MTHNNKRNNMTVLMVAILFFTVSGCASMPSFQSKDNLSEYHSDQVIDLNNDTIYQIKKGAVNWFFGVDKGTYIAKYQDETGYYYQGSGHAACLGTVDGTGGCTNKFIGGIWQSKTEPDDYRVYYIDGTSEEDQSDSAVTSGREHTLLNQVTNAIFTHKTHEP